MKSSTFPILGVLLLLCAPADAYVILAAAYDANGTYGVIGAKAVAGYSSVVRNPWLPGMPVAEFCWTSDGSDRLSRYMLPYDPREWRIVLRANEEYPADHVCIRMWTPDPSYLLPADPAEPWALVHGDTELWRGTFFAIATSEASAPLALRFDFSTWGDLRYSELELTFKAVPEPSSILGLLSGMAGLAWSAARRRH